MRGRPRYWTRVNHLTWSELDEPAVTGSSLELLDTVLPDALRTCGYPWAKLTGLYVAPDILSEVETVLADHGRTLDAWLTHFEGQDPKALTCKYVWWQCGTFTRRPVDAYWMTARPEVMLRYLGGLSRSQVDGLKRNPREPVGMLVDRKGRVLMTEAFDYPYSHMWLTSPFTEVEEFAVHALVDLWNVAPQRPA